MTQEKWVRHSLSQMSKALSRRHYQIGRTTIRRLLGQMKYRLLSNRKSLTPGHPDRDRQFRFIRRVRNLFLAAGRPILSVDTKKKELIGNFKASGRQWASQPTLVKAHDFPSEAEGRAVPYGLYDLTHNQGYVYVGTSYDTPEFAAHVIAQWWADPDRPRFPREDKLLILCDGGGSNNCRYWMWKWQVQQQLANQFGIEVLICHYPTGASKWNPIEYRLFSQITRNWAAKPLTSWSVMLNYIRNTTTETGLTVKAFLVDRAFEKGLSVSPADKRNLALFRRRICPTWNYIIKPQPAPT